MTYPSDLRDAQWTVIEPLLPANKARGKQRYSRRELLNAIFMSIKPNANGDVFHQIFPV